MALATLSIGLVAASAAAALAQESPDASVCEQPLEPVYALSGRVSDTATITGVQPTAVSSLSASPPVLDTDGDGAADQVVVPAPTNPPGPAEPVTIRRSDGDLLLTAGSMQVGYPLALGDLDGDGRTDFAVFTVGDPSTADDVVVMAPPSPGAYDIFDVGVTLPKGSYAGVAVGDQDDDGVPDVGIGAVPEFGVTTIASGRDLIAPGAGGRLASIPPTIVPIEGGLAAIVNLRDSGPPALVELVGAPLPAGSTALVVHDAGRTIDLKVTLLMVSNDSGFGINGSAIGFVDTNGRHIVQVSASSRGGGSSTFDWDLDPCLTPVDVSSEPPAASGNELARTGRPVEGYVALAGGSIIMGLIILMISSRARPPFR